MKKFLGMCSNITEYLMNPISPITILIISVFINSLIANKKNLPPWVQGIITMLDLDMIIVILLFWAILAVVYSLSNESKRKHEHAVNNLSQEIESQKRQIEYNSGMLVKRYGELAAFNKRAKMLFLLKSIVESHSMINMAQIYSYSSKVGDSKTLKIRIKYEEGFAYEGVEGNSILQSYFKVPLATYKKFTEILDMVSTLYEENFESDEIVETIQNSIFQKSNELIGEIITVLNSIKNEDEVDDTHAVLYRLLVVLIELIQGDAESGIVFDQVLANPDMENHIIKYKRTGMLGSILLKDNYMFRHSRPGEKNGRIYLSYCFKLYGEEYIMLLAIPPNELISIEDFNLGRVVEKIFADITNRLESEF